MLKTLLAVMLVPISFFLTNAYLLIRHLQGDTTTSSGTGTDSQYPATEHHHHLGHHGKHSQEATGTGTKPGLTDKIVGGVEKVTGKMTSNTEMYQRGEGRAVSWVSSIYPLCSKYLF